MRSSTQAHDLTAQARIRDAALRRFPTDGFGGTTIRAVADDAGVSPALVLHHFGSKEGLRLACDRHVVERIRTVKGEAITQGGMSDPGFIASAYQMANPLVTYLGWALANGNQAAADLFDEMLEESIRLLALAEERGMVRPSSDPRARAAVMLTMQLGGLVLADHLSRALDADVLSLEGTMTFSRVVMEIFTDGIFTPETAADTAAALQQATDDLRKDDHDG